MNNFTCLICEKSITLKVYENSMTYYGVPLCFPHRRMIDESRASPQVMKLFFALRSYKLPFLLGYRDTLKTVDIALPGKLYIEVGLPSQADAHQTLTEWYKTISINSQSKTIPTLRIPHSLILDEFQFRSALARIIETCMELKKAG